MAPARNKFLFKSSKLAMFLAHNFALIYIYFHFIFNSWHASINLFSSKIAGNNFVGLCKLKVLSGERKYPSRNTYIHIYAKILLQIFVIFFSKDFFWQSKSNSSQVNKTYELCVCCFGQEIFNRFPLYVDVTAPERAERKKTENNEKNLAVISKDFANESRRTFILNLLSQCVTCAQTW